MAEQSSKARTLAQPLSGMKDDGPALELDRDAVNGLLKIVAVQNPQFVWVYTAWECPMPSIAWISGSGTT